MDYKSLKRDQPEVFTMVEDYARKNYPKTFTSKKEVFISQSENAFLVTTCKTATPLMLNKSIIEN